jgi:RNA polymerase sigma factor (TIGR02999 family)
VSDSEQDTEQGDVNADVTRLLHAWRGGDRQALDRLMPIVYKELRVMAGRYMSRERPDHTFQPTALVNEAFLRLSGSRGVDWQNRAHFFGIAAQMMRRILVDRAREAKRLKRGGDVPRFALEDTDQAAVAAEIDPFDALALDRSLTRLETINARQARIVELRFFGGLTVEETAEVMSVSSGTVKRDWVVARAWLYRDLTGGSSAPPAIEG